MSKFKIKELDRLTNAYSYNGNGYTLKITYDENDDKCIEIETNINEKRINELEKMIQKDKERFYQDAVRFCVQPRGELIYKEYNELKDSFDMMQQHICEYDRLKERN